MSRLVCEKHHRRSLVLPTGKVVHRSGGECSTKRLKIHKNIFTVDEVLSDSLLSTIEHKRNLNAS